MAETKTVTKTPVTKLPPDIFNLDNKNQQALNDSIRAYQADARVPGAHTLTRGLVRGGGKKPWRQKGTGRARAGSIRSPIWRGGGVTFGPSNKANYRLKLTVKTKQLALRQALSLKAKAGDIEVIKPPILSRPKTKELAKILDKYLARPSLLVIDKPAKDLARAAANLPRLKLVSARYLNSYTVMRADKLLITEAALGVIKDWLGSVKTVNQKPEATK